MSTFGDSEYVDSSDSSCGSLELLFRNAVSKYKQTGDYLYARRQLISIRHELTVLGFRDVLTVEVYETHARMAIENKDVEEFQRC